tara:strand:+ start:1679 stop:2053 length:375 start_codon:yes stop_codon:yes gene_type:complete
MPYVEEERLIQTNVVGVASGKDKALKQATMADMYKNPEIVDLLYLKGQEVWVKYTDQAGTHKMQLGEIKHKYLILLENYAGFIWKWQITGGGPIEKRQINLLGKTTDYVTAVKNHGLNLFIKLK